MDLLTRERRMIGFFLYMGRWTCPLQVNGAKHNWPTAAFGLSFTIGVFFSLHLLVKNSASNPGP